MPIHNGAARTHGKGCGRSDQPGIWWRIRASGKLRVVAEVVVFVALVGIVTVGSIVHACRRGRWLWAVFILAAPGTGLLAYWVVEAVRPRSPDWPSRLA